VTALALADASLEPVNREPAPAAPAEPPNPTPPRTLRGRLTLLVLVALLPAFLFAIWDATRSYRDELANEEERLGDAATALVNEQQSTLLAIRALLLSLASVPEIRSFGPACRTVASHALEAMRDRGVAAVGLFDADGRWRCGSFDLDRPVDVSDRRWFEELQQGREWVISELLESRIVPVRGFVAAVPLRDAAGIVDGGIGILVAADQIARAYGPLMLGDDGVFVFLDRDNQPVVGASDSNAITARIPPDPAALLGKAAAGERPIARGADGVLRIYAVHALFEGQLRVLAGISVDDVYGPLNQRLAMRLLPPLLMLLIAAAVTWVGVDRLLIRWVQALRETTRRYAQGRSDPSATLAERAPEEIRDLATDVRLMGDALASREQALQDALGHRELLVREVHHRVKNNLQTVISLLSLHARRVSGGEARRVFEDASARLAALALVHRRLYETERLEEVDMAGLLIELCNDFRAGRPAAAGDVDLVVTAEPVALHSTFAVPIGLLVSEGVMNAYKHAFVGRNRGRIAVTFEHGTQPDEYVLTIRDDGLGFRPEANGTGLGMSLIRGFAEQIGGSVRIEREDGTAIVIVFAVADT
jgi:two-component sensor histidine kinase